MPDWVRKLSPRAILIGGVADIVATNVALSPLAVLVFARDPRALDPSYESTAAFTGALDASPTLFTVALLLGSVCSVFGGWVSARIAKREARLNGAFSAYGCVLLSVYGFIATPSAIPTWQFFALSLLAVALGALGGVVFERRGARTLNVASPPLAADPERDARRHRMLLAANRLLLVVTVIVAGLFLFAMVLTLAEGGSYGALAILLVMLCVAMLCYLVAARRLKGGRESHWAWHAAASMLTLIPSGILVLGVWLAVRAG